jgi:DNA modification methylase
MGLETRRMRREGRALKIEILVGDCRERLREMEAGTAQCCVTSPPYFGLRDYGHGEQMGLEPTPDEFVAGMVDVFREVRRVLRDDGTLWLNIGDSYAGSGKGPAGNLRKENDEANMWRTSASGLIPQGCKQKDLIGIPWMLAFALRADGWYLRQDIIWSKPNPMPESVQDRCTKAHEYLFLLSKGPRYYYGAAAIAEQATGQKPGNTQETRNKRSVWEVATQPFSEAHFATYPPALIEPCILAGSPEGATVLDPFGGAGTTGLVADRLRRNAILIEINPEYAALAERRLRNEAGMFADVSVSHLPQGKAA